MDEQLLLSNEEILAIQTSAGIVAEYAKSNWRIAERMAYRVTQPLGPYGYWGMPKPEMFFNVLCRDISRSGMSFLLPEVPDFQLAVVVLGRPNDPKYVFIRTLYSRKLQRPAHGYLVGACFLRRLTPEETALMVAQSEAWEAARNYINPIRGGSF